MYNKNVWKKYDNYDELMKFNEEYKQFISTSKTERLCVSNSIKLAAAKGFVDIKTVSSLKPGDKVYATNKNKNIAVFIIGNHIINTIFAIFKLTN